MLAFILSGPMDPLSPLPAMAALLLAIATSFVLAQRFGAPPSAGRYASIDGLRGYLALFVFFHHASIWYFYLRSGRWDVPPSNLYTHFGQSSVALFFMITGFLFFSKLISGRSKPIDWASLFISRVLRLLPLYLFVMLLLAVIVIVLSHGVLNEPPFKLIKESVHWLGFTVLGAPNVNGVEHTANIVAWVTWSLPYEWFFYFSLPVLALSVGVMPPLRYIALGVASIVALFFWHPEAHHLLAFCGGIAACAFVRVERFRRFAASTGGSVVAVACVALAVAAYPSAYGIVPLLLLATSFALIACGATLFGALASPLSRTLGEMAYSIYLLHGMTLFIAFNFVFATSTARTFSPLTHWLVVIALTPVLVAMSFLTFHLIEKPAMQSTPAFMAWLRSRPIFAAVKPG